MSVAEANKEKELLDSVEKLKYLTLLKKMIEKYLKKFFCESDRND